MQQGAGGQAGHQCRVGHSDFPPHMAGLAGQQQMGRTARGGTGLHMAQGVARHRHLGRRNAKAGRHLFEQAAADGTPVREIVGEDPVEFVEAFVQNYSEGGYVPTRGRKRLTDAIARAEEERPR